MFRLAAVLAFLVTLSACDLVGSDAGEFEATVSGDVSTALAGPAISDVQEEGTTIVLIAEGANTGSNVRILVDPARLAVTSLPLGGDVASLTYALTGRDGQIPFDATSGTLVLDRVEDVVEGTFEAVAVSPGGAEVTIEGAFRAPHAITP